jgi:hypothetical protein
MSRSESLIHLGLNTVVGIPYRPGSSSMNLMMVNCQQVDSRKLDSSYDSFLNRHCRILVAVNLGRVTFYFFALWHHRLA